MKKNQKTKIDSMSAHDIGKLFIGGIALFVLVVLLDTATKTHYDLPQVASVGLSQQQLGQVSDAPTFLGGERKEARQIIVYYKKNTGAERRSEVANRHTLKSKGKIPQLDVEIYEIDQDDTAEEVVGRMRSHESGDVEYVEVDEVVAPALTPNDTKYSSQWSKNKTNHPLAWDIVNGNSEIIVGIADTGVDCSHPELTANCVPGWNFWDNNNDSRDVHGHGTAVAGVIGAVGNNMTGVAGSLWNVKIMPLRISDLQGYATWSRVASAITYAADRGVKVINNSYGSSQSATVQSAAQYLWNKGGVFVNSAGNSGADTGATVNSPYIVTVSGTDSSDNKYSWSSYGKDVDVSAPGCTGATTAWSGKGYLYQTFCGTSHAAPETAGIVAMMYAMRPNFTPSQVTNFLFSGAKDYSTVGWDSVYGWGRVDAFGALTLAQQSLSTIDLVPPTAPTNLSVTSLASNRIALAWGASTDNIAVTNYLVHRNGFRYATTSYTTLSYADSGVSPEQSYVYTVHAVDEAGNISSSSQSVSATTPSAPLSVTSSSVSSKTKTSAVINWSTSVPSVGYVRYGTSQTAMNSIVADSIPASTHASNLTDLRQKTTYYYQIVATKPDGSGTTTSTTSSFRTPNR